MNINRKTFLKSLAVGAASAAGVAPWGGAQAQADSYPNKPVKLIVPFAAGGFADGSGRLLGQMIQAAWGQPMVVDNRVGAGGIYATETAAKSAPDGYTLYFVSDGPLVINPFLYKQLPYDPINDFIPIAMVAATTMVLIVNPERVKARNLAEFLAEAKARPANNPMTFGSAGFGSPHQLVMENLKSLAGVNLTHVPYKGGAPALQAVLANEIDAAFSNHEKSIALWRSGKVRAIAFGGQQRSPIAPELPTVAESFPGFEASPWIGVVAPKGTPQAIVDKVERDVLKVARDPGFQKQLFAVGGDPLVLTASGFRDRLRSDYQMYGKLIRSMNVVLQ